MYAQLSSGARGSVLPAYPELIIYSQGFKVWYCLLTMKNGALDL